VSLPRILILNRILAYGEFEETIVEQARRGRTPVGVSAELDSGKSTPGGVLRYGDNFATSTTTTDWSFGNSNSPQFHQHHLAFFLHFSLFIFISSIELKK
jgi:hypothetical protein